MNDRGVSAANAPPSGGYYERYWSSGGHSPTGGMYGELEEVLLAHVPSGASCLDVGCGDGRTAGPWLVGRGCRYVGVDVSSVAVAKARSAGLDAQTIGDAGSLPFPGDSFDVALCLEVLEHLFEPQTAAAEIFRVLRPGGLLIATVPNVAYWRRRAELFCAGRWDPTGDSLSVAQPWRDPHIRFFTTSTLRRMLSSAGFDPVTVTGFGGSLVRDLPWIGFRLPGSRRALVSHHAQRLAPSLFAARLRAVAHKRGSHETRPRPTRDEPARGASP